MVENERLSALVDEEVDDSELRRAIADLSADPEARARWGRYHLIGSAMRGQVPNPRMDLSRRVAQALETETPAPVVPLRRPGLSRPAIGLAVAASVTAVAILTVQTLGPGDEAPVVASSVPAAATGRETAEPRQDRDRRLNPYLINHNEYAAASGMQGVLPYVRVVSHDER